MKNRVEVGVLDLDDLQEVEAHRSGNPGEVQGGKHQRGTVSLVVLVEPEESRQLEVEKPHEDCEGDVQQRDQSEDLTQK